MITRSRATSGNCACICKCTARGNDEQYEQPAHVHFCKTRFFSTGRAQRHHGHGDHRVIIGPSCGRAARPRRDDGIRGQPLGHLPAGPGTRGIRVWNPDSDFQVRSRYHIIWNLAKTRYRDMMSRYRYIPILNPISESRVGPPAGYYDSRLSANPVSIITPFKLYYDNKCYKGKQPEGVS